ncbi:response regulator transcription factor [Streptomyces microflavus]|uniref:response regulator transcription factor n=1 Tax=Streptomyces microflavus TaxID=1919 RepID=UPI003B223DA1
MGPSPSGGGPAVSLSPRQTEILQHIAAGLNIPETAHTMHLAVSTVHYHQQVILTVLKARNLTNAVFLACRAGCWTGGRAGTGTMRGSPSMCIGVRSRARRAGRGSGRTGRSAARPGRSTQRDRSRCRVSSLRGVETRTRQ